MGIWIEYKMHAEEVLRRFNQMRNRLSRNADLWQQIADDFADMNRKQFSSEGRFAGGWVPLKIRYAASKQSRYPGTKILHRSGALERSLTQQPFGVDIRRNDYAVFGTNLLTGQWHQKGAGKLPQRQIIVVNKYRTAKWAKFAKAHILSKKGS